MIGKREAGFTIVETLIVLAIAGLILTIVFLALPSLQRSGRNNQRTQDVQTVLQAVSHYELNNSGTFPNTSQLRNFLNAYQKGKLTIYDVSGITSNPTSPSNNLRTYPASPVGLSRVVVTNHAKCVIGGSANNQGAGYSDVVALYAMETAGGSSAHCQQL